MLLFRGSEECDNNWSPILFGVRLIHGFILIVTWICEVLYMDFSKLLLGFIKIDPWVSLSCYLDLSKLLHVFLALCQVNHLKFDQDFKDC